MPMLHSSIQHVPISVTVQIDTSIINFQCKLIKTYFQCILKTDTQQKIAWYEKPQINIYIKINQKKSIFAEN